MLITSSVYHFIHTRGANLMLYFAHFFGMNFTCLFSLHCRRCQQAIIEIMRSVFYIQSTLVISTSVISNNRLSRRENLVPVLTKKSKIR